MSNSAIPAISSKIRFYVDGLNFYHRVAKIYKIKWIDIEKLLLRLIREKIPNAEVDKVIIFTAMVRNYKIDEENDSRQRQQTYLDALRKHSPNIKIVKGLFKEVEKKGKVREVIQGSGQKGDFVEIETREEKETDVNIACRIIEDAYEDKEGAYIPCLVSNDSDLAYPLRFKKRREERIFLITPTNKKASYELKILVPKKDRILKIEKTLVESCRLPDKVGKFSIPEKWKQDREKDRSETLNA